MKTFQHIIISGSVAYDRIMDFKGRFRDHILPDKIHNLNVSFHADTFHESYGGTAGNIAYSLALLGERPVVMASVGRDFMPYRVWMRRHHIDLQYVKTVGGAATASAFIITDQDDNQIAAFSPGAMNTPAKPIPGRLLGRQSLGIIAPGNLRDMVRYASQYRKSSTRYLFDPGQQITSFSGLQLQKCLRGAYGFISNDYELALVLKKTGWPKSKLLGSVGIVVTTLGSKGSVVYSEGKTYRVPIAVPKNTSDPTGAGDAYRSGFIKGLQLGWPLPHAGRLGAVVSVYSVEMYGTQTHRFTWPKVSKRFF
ncbi:MAG: carbohydrate kinase family protein [Patescibacteria group bacterium]